jgi:hypothetical protein
MPKTAEAMQRYGKSCAVWFGIFVLLFNLLNSGGMGFQPMLAQAAICHSSGHGQPDQPQQRSADCACCLALCCAGTVLPDAEAARLQPPSTWIFLSYLTPRAAAPRPARVAGGFARAPPALA